MHKKKEKGNFLLFFVVVFYFQYQKKIVLTMTISCCKFYPEIDQPVPAKQSLPIMRM